MMRTSTLALCLLSQHSTPYKRWLDEEEKRRRDRRYPRISLRTFRYSSFYKVYASRCDQALLNATGHDFNSFDNLLRLFAPFYHLYTFDDEIGRIRKKILEDGKPKGRPRDLSACGCLGLVLMWYRTKGSCARALSMMFGQTSTPMYKWLKFGRKVLLHVLSRHDAAKVKLPTAAESEGFKAAVAEKYPYCPDVWGAGDGLKLFIDAPTSYSKQLRYYNGWKCSHYISCVFVFSVDGKIRVAILNAPGNFHDSTIADYGFYTNLEEVYDRDGGKVVVDSAFAVRNAPYLIKSSQTNPFDMRGIAVNEQATSIRQLSEWGMRIIQATFPRVKEPLRYEEDGDRMIILKLMVCLYNYQTEMMGQNQIFNSYMNKDEGYYGYDDINEYYF